MITVTKPLLGGLHNWAEVWDVNILSIKEEGMLCPRDFSFEPLVKFSSNWGDLTKKLICSDD